MTRISEMVEQLVATDASAAAILVAVRHMESVTPPVTSVTRDSHAMSRVTDPNKKRHQAKLRKRKQRKRQKETSLTGSEAQANDGATAGVTVTRDSVTPPCDLLSIQERGLSIKTKKVSKKETENARATRMQPGALLTDPLRQAAIDLGARPEEVSGAWAEFVDFWIGVPGTRGTKLNWPATWRNRVRTILARGKGSANGRRTVHDAANDLAAKIRAFDDEPPGGIRGGTGEAPIRLLSSR